MASAAMPNTEDILEAALGASVATAADPPSATKTKARRASAPKPPPSERVHEPSAPMPGADEMDDDEDGPSMEDWLLKAGARRDRRGRWFREVPDPRTPKRLEIDEEEGVAYEVTDYVRRWVAVAASPEEAVAKARAANGTHDAYLPGVGWVRNGRKIETEHPSNVGVQTSGPTKSVRRRIAIDSAEAQKAIALKNALKAAHREARQEED